MPVDVSFVATCMRCRWRGMNDLVECIDIALSEAEHAPSLRGEHLGELQDFGAYVEVAHLNRRILWRTRPAVPPGLSTFNRLRDPEVFRHALAASHGNHRRAAAYLKLTLEGFERWLERHGIPRD